MNHSPDGETVIDPSGREGEKQRGKGKKRGYYTDLPSLEPDLQKVEGYQKEYRIDGQLSAEVNEMNLSQ
jgi:hypothetical protein